MAESSFRSFVSESELEQKRKLRQQQWEQTRRPDQPLEAPEDDYDPRTLYERLKEQRDRKQQEFEEAHKLKNLIKGLDDDEVNFLGLVDEQKIKEEKLKLAEEEAAILEYQSRLKDKKPEDPSNITSVKPAFRSTVNATVSQISSSLSSIRARQARLLKMVRPRKESASESGSAGGSQASGQQTESQPLSSDSSSEQQTSRKRTNEAAFGSENVEQKQSKQTSMGNTNDDGDDKKDYSVEQKGDDSSTSSASNQQEAVVLQPAHKVLGVLPGLSCYDSDTSDSDAADSDQSDEVSSSELDSFLASGKARQIIRPKREAKQQKLTKKSLRRLYERGAC